MKIIYAPSISGTNYLRANGQNVNCGVQVLETQGLLSQLALHAGIHVEIPSYPIRLADYHYALMKYDATYPDNLFHKSIAIDSMSVAKTLLGWRDGLRLAGWNCHGLISDRLDALSVIETNYQEKETGLPILLRRVEGCLKQMVERETTVPNTFKELEIEVLCPKEMLPDYLMPVYESLEQIVAKVNYGTIDTGAMPREMVIAEFPQQYKAEAWLSWLHENTFDVWINSDNKRLDNWLHMSGKPVAGSDMQQSNPQVTQMFLLAIQLFQRPLNVNILLQYLYLPECPLPWKLTSRLASTIVREGGFTSSKVLDCVNDYLNHEFKKDDDTTPCELSLEERLNSYQTYLPFDLRNESIARVIANESADISVKELKTFLLSIRKYASERAVKISAVKPYDLRVEQLREVSTLVDAMMVMLDGADDTIPFAKFQQWAQSLYEASDYCQFNAQVGSRLVACRPENIVTKASNVIWCDFYGDISSTLSTDFLSPDEIEEMQRAGIRLWDTEREKAYRNFMLELPLHQTKEKLTFVVCKQKGTTEIPTHPLRLQLPEDTPIVNGDELFDSLPSVDIQRVENRREEDAKMVTFDAQQHKVTWRDQESYSALEKLLQTPLDYFMNYTLGFSDKGPTEIKMSLANGNVAHETIEMLFTAGRGDMKLKEYVEHAYESAFEKALACKGALLLLPEHHLDKDKLRHQLKRCVVHLADIIEANGLKVVTCEQEEIHSLGFEEGIKMAGYIDMLLKDKAGRDVVFDLKWTSSKDKHKNLIKENRDAQLTIYQAMLQQHADHHEAARTAFFVMPKGNIVSVDDFEDCHYEKIERKSDADIMDMLRKGYTERRKEISEGRIETSEDYPIEDLQYSNVDGVFPLEVIGRKIEKDGRNVNIKVKAENKYSDYKCFTL